jgi:hypothetical protein
MHPPKGTPEYDLYVERQKASSPTRGKKLPPRSKEHSDNISKAKKGKPSGKKGTKVSPEGCENIRLGKLGSVPWNKGISMRESTKEKLRIQHTGLKASESTKEKMRESSHKGVPRPEEVREKIRKGNLGKPKSPEHNEKNRLSHLGQIPYNKGVPANYENVLRMVETKIGGLWYGSVKNDLSLGGLIRQTPEYKIWTKAVIERDGGKDHFTGELCIHPEAHHIVSIAKLISKYDLKTLNDARNCKEMWDVDNGMTLEYENHMELHFGSKWKEVYD